MDIGAQQKAFDSIRDRLIEEGHEGEFVLMQDGQIVDFFPGAGEAYAKGLDLYGLERPFLIARVEPLERRVSIMHWTPGQPLVSRA